ncbi:hypothetical protein GC207_03305 [bacterium]|nr:hypothetical protein [bacterium]
MKRITSFVAGVSLFVGVYHAPAQFTKVTTGPLVSDSGAKLTTVWADIDRDGKVDGFVPNVGGSSFLYHNLGNASFESLTSSPVAQTIANSTAAAWGDYDNDGNIDLFVANRWQDHFLYRGLGGTNFEVVTNSAVLAGGPETYSCSWVDYDNDGYLDLFVVNLFSASYLYHNNGDGTFTKNTTAAIANGSTSWGGSAWGDFNNDGRIDVYMVGFNATSDSLYRNDGNGTFTSAASGAMLTDAGGGTSASWADYDNDGDLDLFVANRDGVNFLYRNDGQAGFTKITTGEIATDVADSNAGIWGDYDNDGWLDLYVANGDTPANQANFLYHNNHDGTFTKTITGAPVTDTDFSASPVWVDYDNDGHLDLFIANATGGNTLYHNDGNTNHWLKIDLVGSLSNRSAIGAKIKVTAQIGGTTLTQMRQVSGDGGFVSQNLTSHFGLGDATSVSTVRVEWPSGRTTVLTDVTADQRLTINEGDAAFTHVLPDGLQGNDGNYYAGTLYSPGMRSQVVYGASNFPQGPLTITEIRFRRDINEPPVSNASASVTLKLSTTSRSPGGLSTTFADNTGSDEVTVFDGTWTYSSPSTVANGVVRPFDIVLPLTTPFTYDPSAGNLLFDIRTTSNTGSVWTDGVNSSQLSRVQASFDPNAATGNAEQTGDVIQLTYSLGGVPGLSIYPNGGTFTNSVQVTISNSGGTGTVYYTTDGSDPTDASTTYSGAFTLTDTTTVKARLYVNGYPASDISSATFTLYTPPDIQFNPPGQLFTNQISVALINNVGAGVIRYTTDGSAPTTSSAAYSSAFALTAGATVQAQVFVNSFPVSAVFSETYSRVYVFESDGIPFSWLEQYFGAGYLTNPDAAANADSDHDGYTNLEEYQNGTVPTDAGSAPEIVLTVKSVPRLTFTTIAGRSYRIDRTTTLNPPDWQTIVDSVTADGTELHYVDENAPDNSYYRIELISP